MTPEASWYDAASFWVGLIGTIATLAALGFAIWFGVHEIRALRADADRRAAEAREREVQARRSQAEQVSGYLKLTAGGLARDRFGPGMAAEYWTGSVEVTNSSVLPIYNLETFSLSDRPGEVFRTATGVLAGGQVHHAHVPPQNSGQHDRSPVDLWFSDAAGVSWHRSMDGDLHEVDADHEPSPSARVDRP